jgi:hypothetical protein
MQSSKQLTCKYGISCHDGWYRGIESLLIQQLERYVRIALEKSDLSIG